MVKCHDSSLYSCLSLDPNLSVTGDEDCFVKMWDALEDSGSSVMTYKRFDEYMSSFLKMDDNYLLASSGEGTIQSFDLRPRRPDIQTEVYEWSRSWTAWPPSGAGPSSAWAAGWGPSTCSSKSSNLKKIREVFKKLPNCVSGHEERGYPYSSTFWPKFQDSNKCIFGSFF